MSDPDTGDFEGLRPQEATDSDERGEEDYTDPPDDWAAADRFGTTPREQREGRSLSLRLTDELPEDAPPEPEGGAPPDTGWPHSSDLPDQLHVVDGDGDGDELERRG